MERSQPNSPSNIPLNRDNPYNQEGLVDILEIYHARQLREHILGQLRRIRGAQSNGPLLAANHSRKLRDYYESMLVTVSELLYEVGDH